jgi:hypothetical protein
MTSGEDDIGRLERIEAHLQIQQLPIRYALAVDGRDVDAWVNLFVPDVNMGRRGQGREALRAYIEPQIRQFYRSIHFICGHRIEVLDGETGRGAVYCRAEHEVGDRWIVMAICYFDDYRRVSGEWLFERRRERHWYAADVNEAPQAAGFHAWGSEPGLPQEFPSWAAFWNGQPTLDPVTTLP